MLKQMNKDLPTFLGEFHRLAAAAKVSEVWQIDNLREKLNDRFRSKIIGQSFNDIFEMVRMLEQIDQHMRSFDQDKASRPNTNTRKFGLGRQGTPAAGNQEKSAATEDKVKKEPGESKTNEPFKCYNCNQLGHMAKNCPQGQGKDAPSSKS
ncbi:hypothetical protein GJ744_005249 [Endocarpon pusillum]|uniref:CCHC-type domain-containing protein n=1 Tax=Endocarpon pusillum TaxID=364733 RepID=A0A8H7A6Q8_9EURO|nr:hypothetical protein GJ744_005249 [Endocarpon pusillum]